MIANRGFLPDGFDRRLTPARPDLAAESLQGIVAAQLYVAPRRMRVRSEVVALRAEPHPEAGMDTQALFGERIDIYEIDIEGWAWGQLARDRYVGYMAADDLTNDVAEAEATHRILAPRTFIYPARNIKSPPISALPMNALVHVMDDDGTFARLREGFVQQRHLALLDVTTSDFVSVAERFLHAPYLWGGKTWLGLDCSGLIQTALAASGTRAPRDTDMMERQFGDSPDITMFRGDLIFWKGHVGVMRDAEHLLHASGHHMQVVSEPFAQARARIAAKAHGEVTAIRRLEI
jgi:cell wall-associated NlpC family hydrolase